MNPQTQTHDEDRRPTWQVQSVFDPDGGGKDFAYTIGLSELGHPELHLWARPSLGEDPGEDWSFSPRDRTMVLNELAWLLLAGDLGVGSELTREYDAGETRVHLRLDPPGDIEELEAFGVAPGARVLPVRWSLERVPEGPPRALTSDDARQARALRRRILDPLDRNRLGPIGWDLDGRAVYVRHQIYGPLTPVVRARAAQLWQADLTSMNCLLRAAGDVAAGGSLTWPVTLAHAAARRSGRRQELARLEDDVVKMLDELTTSSRWARWWEPVAHSLWGPDIMGEPELARRARAADKSLLLDVTLACLSAEAVADVLPPEVLVQARGPWAHGVEPASDVPTDLRASQAVVEVVSHLLGPLTHQQLGQIAVLHRLARDGRVEEWSAYGELASRLRGWALIGPAGCPWGGVLDELPGWGPMVDGLGLGDALVTIAPLEDLHEWATLISSALCHRPRLSNADVAVLAAPYQDLLPSLRRILNEPIVTVVK